MAKNHGRAWIIHGDKDTVLPVTMSETLSREYKDTVKLSVIPGGGHGDIFGVRKEGGVVRVDEPGEMFAARDKNGVSSGQCF